MVGESLHASCLRIAQHLADGYARSGGPPCTFSIVGAGDIVRTPRQTINCTLYAYRFAQNQNLRSARPRDLRPRASGDAPPAVLDVHLLLTAWAERAEDELAVLGWVARELNGAPRIEYPTPGGTAMADVVADELSLADLGALWRALALPLRPSLTYVIRQVAL
ncbi:MAG: Pvc16 family protein [Pseudomonadota bacterium]